LFVPLVLEHTICYTILETEPIQTEAKDFDFPFASVGSSGWLNIQNEPQALETAGIYGTRRLVKFGGAARERVAVDK
jgi:hypothetical protein